MQAPREGKSMIEQVIFFYNADGFFDFRAAFARFYPFFKEIEIRPEHPGRRPEIAPEKIRDADNGRLDYFGIDHCIHTDHGR